ncbi:LEPR-XLL domain-containing protein [Salmonella enterica]|nr:LEPR-XLL domain-containing protein [Salmonella enterica]
MSIEGLEPRLLLNARVVAALISQSKIFFLWVVSAVAVKPNTLISNVATFICMSCERVRLGKLV